jgi:sugar lactone lactonase YvrE
MTPAPTSPVRQLTAEPIDTAPRCVLAESPRWHDDRWWWVDAAGGSVFSATVDRGEWRVRQWFCTSERVSVVHPAGPGRLLITRGHQLQYLDSRMPEKPGPAFGTVPMAAGWLLNDGAADGAGGFWIGVVSPDRAPGSGQLAHLDPDGGLLDGVGSIALSNGLAFDPSGEILFHADSFDRVVWAHRIGPLNQVMESWVRLRFADDDGMPDGLATDVAGGLWVAVYGAGEVRRYDTAGVLDLVVQVPTPQVTSVALGGPDGQDLLITTAREGYDRARSAAEPLAGRLFRARSPHPGRLVFSAGRPLP